MMKRYGAYIFDLYGTLADIHTDEDRPALWRELAAFYGRQGAQWTPRALRRAYLDAVERAEAERRADGGWPEIDILPVFASLFGAPGLSPGDARAFGAARVFRAASLTRLRAYAGAAELLDGLRAAGKRVFLLSNAQRAFTLPELERIGLAGRFDGVYISSDVGWKKPDPRFFRALLDAQGLDAADCLMIGNDPVCDIGGARGVGMDGLYIRSGLSPKGLYAGPEPVLTIEGMDLRRARRILLKEA